jgi:phosphoribosylanthranilate isomerase
MDTRTRVKICGITNEEDARAAVACGADALGFIRVPGGPRYVSEPALLRVAYASRPFVSTVLVVRRPEDAGDYHADFIQFYEEELVGPCGPPEAVLPPSLAGRLVRAFRVRDADSLGEIERYPYRDAVAAFHLDTFHEDRLGGSGEAFDWDLAVEAKRIAGDTPIILAGGLNPDNVGDAIARVRPYAVDVSSGVEAEPGRKDHEKLKAFLRAVRAADQALDG